MRIYTYMCVCVKLELSRLHLDLNQVSMESHTCIDGLTSRGPGMDAGACKHSRNMICKCCI